MGEKRKTVSFASYFKFIFETFYFVFLTNFILLGLMNETSVNVELLLDIGILFSQPVEYQN